MKALVEKLCLDVLITALLSIALGVIFFVYPVETVETISRVIALIIFIFGVVQIAMGMISHSGFSFITAIGILITAIGIWVFIYPKVFTGIIPFFIGLLLLVHGMVGIKSAIDAGRSKYERWGVLFGLSVITVIGGILTILNAFDIVVLSAKILGIFLVYDGISGLLVIIQARFAIRRFERTIKENEAIEVQATVIDENNQPKN